MTSKENWHLDKRVPIALIVTLIFQTSGFVWWAATTDQRVQTLEHQIQRMVRQAEKNDDQRIALDKRITVIEVRTEAILNSLARIEKKLN